jgi:hypothetical protein
MPHVVVIDTDGIVHAVVGPFTSKDDAEKFKADLLPKTHNVDVTAYPLVAPDKY